MKIVPQFGQIISLAAVSCLIKLMAFDQIAPLKALAHQYQFNNQAAQVQHQSHSG